MGACGILLWGPDGQGWIVDVEASQLRGVPARAIDEVSWTVPSSPQMIDRGRDNSGSARPKGIVLDPSAQRSPRNTTGKAERVPGVRRVGIPGLPSCIFDFVCRS